MRGNVFYELTDLKKRLENKTLVAWLGYSSQITARKK